MTQVRRAWRSVNGVLPLDKPVGLGSTAVLQHVRRLYSAERAGHTGTLDPMASGLLVLCFGEATKFAGELLEGRKQYRAEVTLGTSTTTGDREGEITASRPVTVNDQAVVAALDSLTGEISQVPPMYSALKREGRPLYEYARQGKTLERAPRRVTIYELRMLDRDGVRLTLEVSCSKGTYIRTLAEDLGEALGCGAHLSALERTGIGDFELRHASTVDQLSSMNLVDRDARLLPIDRLLMACPAVSLESEVARRFVQGQSTEIALSLPPIVRVYGPEDVFLGTGRQEEGRLHPKRLLSQALSGSAPGETKENILEKRGISPLKCPPS